MIFNNRLKSLKEEKEQLQRKVDNYTRYRIFVVALAIGSGFIGGFNLLELLLFFILFLFLVFVHSNLKKSLAKKQHMLDSCQRFLDRQSGKWHDFSFSKPIFLDKNGDEIDEEEALANHPYAKDLDIVGKNSLFQFIDETNTFYGRHMLTHVLTEETDFVTAKQRQKSVAEIADKKEFCEELKATGKISENIANPKDIISYMQDSKDFLGVFKFASCLPILLIVTALMYFFLPSNFLLVIAIGILFFQTIIFFLTISKTAPVLSMFYSFNRGLKSFEGLFNLIEKEKFDSDLNKTMQGFLANGQNKASRFLKTLYILESATTFRRSAVLLLVLNIMFLYDIQILVALDKLRGKDNNLETWLRTVGFFEAMVSIATIPMTFPDWSTPEFNSVQNDLKIKVENMGHPLLHEPVKNNYLHKNISIITGSNMSGKTTFLRSIGVNLVLAYAGSTVCATSFKIPFVSIYTSMRISDSVTENISTFYAELKRIKIIIDRARKNQPMMFLIDEIFRGTNSEDRIEGAKRVLTQLNKSHIIGFITTHDLEVARDTNFENYNFKEYYEDNQIYFDYHIREGISETKNASYLMKMVGIN